MSSKSDEKGSKTFKNSKNKALGSSKANKFKPGDLVTWKTWQIDLTTEAFGDQEGLLIEIIEETRLENIVLIAKILPFGTAEYEFVPLFSLSKSNNRN
jgi:ribosomal protein L19